jgi:hypothetical protein
MGTEQGEVRTLPTGRAFFADERDTYLRATWRPELGFVNMSIWRGAECVATFHLAVRDAARMAGFLVEGLGEVTAALLPAGGGAPVLRLEPPPVAAPDVRQRVAAVVRSAGRHLARRLGR